MSRSYQLTIYNREWAAFEPLQSLLPGEVVSVSYAESPDVAFTVTYAADTPLSQGALDEIAYQLGLSYART